MTTLVGLHGLRNTANPVRKRGEHEVVSGVVETRSPPMIAIVDDDEDVRIALADLLQSFGYDASIFESADAYLRSHGDAEPDIIISDMHMPGTSGLNMARQIQGAGTPVILITAFPSFDLERQAQEAGVVCFLRKPFDPAILIDRLAQLLH